ncbi:MAG: hypothetical protein KTR20_07715 [Cellvibrionaceae bacterium]|nr:hypothetical protein [Cellvibrionaceae bacterium]
MKKGITIGLSIIIAFVFLQSLPFKFTHSLETQHIFKTLGTWAGISEVGDYGGYIVGAAELIAALLLFTKWRLAGAVMALGIMSGAVFFHLFTPLGIIMPYFDAQTGEQIGNDRGLLFMMACATWLCACALIAIDCRDKHNDNQHSA